ncbi:MAG: hypothetical protein ACRC10_00010 [Thermoguttaceae bacterium]
MKIKNEFLFSIAGALSAILIMGLIVILLVIQVLGIFGPFSRPPLAVIPWRSLLIRYQFVQSNEVQIRRSLIIEDADLLNKLRIYYTQGEVQSRSSANLEDMLLILENNGKWQMTFDATDRIYFCNKNDNYYAYCAEFSNQDFYNTLRTACCEHEQTLTPFARLESIKLCPGGLGEKSVPMFSENTPPNESDSQ